MTCDGVRVARGAGPVKGPAPSTWAQGLSALLRSRHSAPGLAGLGLAGWDESGSGCNKKEVTEKKVLTLVSRRTTARKKAGVR